MDTAALLALAAREHGVVSDAQAFVLGIAPRSIRRLVQSGDWQRPFPRVLRCTGAPSNERQAAMAAVLWAGPGARISHAAAAVLWDLDGVHTHGLELTVSNDRRLRSPLVAVHRSLTLAPADGTLRHGVPVTSVLRTLIDVAGSLPTGSLELAVEDAFRRRLTTPTQLDRCLSRIDGRGRTGSGRLRDLLVSRRGEAATGSGAEVLLARLLVSGGLPDPIRQHAVTHAGRTIRVDLAYPDCRLAIEFDSLRWHSGRAKLDNDADRRNLLRAAGWEQITVTHTMLKARPEHTLSVIATAYEERAGICWTKTAKRRPEMSNKPQPTTRATGSSAAGEGGEQADARREHHQDRQHHTERDAQQPAPEPFLTLEPITESPAHWALPKRGVPRLPEVSARDATG
jgi:very-short-patch-repair endonuclease